MWSRMASSPAALLGGEVAAGGLLHGCPAFEALAHAVFEGRKLAGRADGVAHERDDVGQHPLAGAAHPGLVEPPVGLPEPVGCPGAGRRFEGVGELLDIAVAEPLAVGALVEDLQGGDLVPVLLDELLEGAHQYAGLFA